MKSPNPAAQGKHVPLITTYWLSSGKSKEVWLEPVVDRQSGVYHFEVRTGAPPDPLTVKKGTKDTRGGFTCLLSGAPIPFETVREEARKGQLGSVLLAVVAEKKRGRVYLPADQGQALAADCPLPEGVPDTDIPEVALGFRIQNYGFHKHWQMFANRQLSSMVTLSNLIKSVQTDVAKDAKTAGYDSAEASTYAAAVVTFLALALDRCADFNNSLCRWSPSNQKSMGMFGRQAIPMVWDFAEANIMGASVGSWKNFINYVAECCQVVETSIGGEAHQIDAASGVSGHSGLLLSTDPPYYDNIGYAALSDFFYVWLRRTIGPLYPDLFGTVLVPKMEELTAAPERFDGDRRKARGHFETGFRRAFGALRANSDPRFPLSVYYAFKQDDQQAEQDAEEEPEPSMTVDSTTGWETLLEALLGTGFQITATWPVRASQQWRMRAMGANALASYVVLACRPRAADAPKTDRRSFVAQLKQELPPALRLLQQGTVAPVDFAQAAIGPGMAVFSRYSAVLESDGKPMLVRTALGLINQTLTEVPSEDEDEYDSPTRWALAWFQQEGFGVGTFGDAELYTKSKVTSLSALDDARIVSSKAGRVQLLRPEGLPKDWDPSKDTHLTDWGITHQLIRLYVQENLGDLATSEVLAKIGPRADMAKNLAYRLFNICERKKWSQEAQAYNTLVLGWPEIARLAAHRDL